MYHNNLAQAIEILHCIDHSIELLESNQFKEEQHEPVVVKEGNGVGLIEAPRGTLYYMLSIDKTGKVQVRQHNSADPAEPDNHGEERCEAGRGEPITRTGKLEHEIEKLIRAYDPCMSCASHFLKVNWK